MRMGFFYKKISVVAIILSMMFSGLFFSLTTETAKAQIPGIPIPGNDYVPVVQPPTQEKYVGVTIFGHVIPHTSLNSIYILVMKTLLAHITDSIVDWINNGFEGGPSFVTDPKSFLLGVGDEVAGEFINGTEWGWVCDPYRLNIKIALSLGTGNFKRKRKCTLTGIINNFNNFFNGTFKEGGWQSWFQITTNPNQAPFSAFLSVDAELQKRIKQRNDMELKKLDWGKGFFSSQECLAYDKDTKECVKWGPVKTPGTVIESQLENTLGSSLRQMEIADDIDKIVGALTTQLVKMVLQKGLSAMNSNKGWGGTSQDFTNSGSNNNNDVKKITGWCAANMTQVFAGDEITWTASVYDGTTDKNATYVWEGDEIKSGLEHNNAPDLDTVKIAYKRPGTKNASVTAAKNGKTIKLTCENNVAVSIKSDACFADKDYASVGDKVLWTAMTLDGAPATYEWKSSDPDGPFGTSTSVETIYKTGGTKAAMVDVTKENRATSTVVCSTKVLVSSGKLAASCSVDPLSGARNTTQNDGMQFIWTAAATGGAGEYSYNWAGTDNLSGSAATTSARYSIPGNKAAQVTVSDGNEIVTASCDDKAIVN
ncbi:MAG: PKD domain-containing protein [Patescibacteria group bacterium]|nr:hypothetical protein [Patescibacteria group bacterium]MDE1988128.1 PKD domain-containing protein [Patescibacteria group bacterium]MDE2218013.1 PKD domain-containing protein [Patescibacteria group bacterium]